MEIINLKIDVTKITKSRLFKGEKGTYLNCSVIPSPSSKYNDYVVIEDTTKEERAQNVKGVILGNGKVFKRPEQTAAPEPVKSEPEDLNPKDEILPF